MIKTSSLTLVTLFVLSIVLYFFFKNVLQPNLGLEGFVAPYDSSSYWFPYYFPYPYLQTGSRRGMSYDLRGDPFIPYMQVSPWYQATRFPIRNRPLIF